MTNPRYKNGNLRRKNRERLRAQGDVCYLCGRPIHWNEPSDADHPWSFVVDEVIPVSRWKEFGYSSPSATANDFNNLRAAHYRCNALKSNKTLEELQRAQKSRRRTVIVSDGEW